MEDQNRADRDQHDERGVTDPNVYLNRMRQIKSAMQLLMEDMVGSDALHPKKIDTNLYKFRTLAAQMEIATVDYFGHEPIKHHFRETATN